MSYVVCHVQKFKASDVKGIQKHNQRESENSKNKDIDRSKTALNYDLHNANDINYNRVVKEIIKDGFKGDRAIRKDAVVMTSTLISSDGEFFKKLSQQEQKEFFKNTYEYLKERYGEKNIVSAVVHLDETTPHMHLCSIPLTQAGRLSAKILFDRKSLLELQKELPLYLKTKGFEIEKGSGEKKHIEINEFKEQTLKNKSKELDIKISEVNSLETKINKTIDTLKSHLKPLHAVEINEYELNKIQVKKKFMSSKVEILEGDLNKITDLARKQIINAREYDDLKNENSRLKEDSKEYREMIHQKESKIEDLGHLLKNYNVLNNKMSAFNKTLGTLDITEREEILQVYKVKLAEIEKPKVKIQNKSLDWDLEL